MNKAQKNSDKTIVLQMLCFLEVKDMISFENVSRYILSQINIHIPAGTSVGLVGASGAGKTTFLRLACGLLKCDSGSIYVNGRCQTFYSGKMSKELGVLFADKPILNSEESVCHNFKTLKTIYRLSEKEYQKNYIRLSVQLGFAQFEEKKVKTLSLGQRRRAELGAVLLHTPKILLLDEPTIGLDENAKQAIYNILQEYMSNGTTAVISSHDLTDISRMCQRIAVLNKGKLIYYGKKELLLKKFAPLDRMYIKLLETYPDLEDLPLERYFVENDLLTLFYNSNHITSAEILRTVISQTSIKEVTIKKGDLADIILKIERKKDEGFY